MDGNERNDWNVFKQIFFDHWDSFKAKHNLYDNEYYDELVVKMLDCGNPDKMGYVEYKCMNCGGDKHKVSMSCKSFLCLRCGKVYVDDWVSQVSRMLHPGIIYRHTVLTVPEILRPTFYNTGKDLFNSLFKCGVKCLDDFFSTVSRKTLTGGYIVVLQTHGRNGQYNPHLHIISTSGGYEDEREKWHHLSFFSYPMLHKKWQWHLLEMLKEELNTDRIHALVDYCYKKYPKGFVANVQKGDVPNRYKSLSKYLAKYVVSPPISVNRIDAYEADEVTYHYKSHKTKKVETETVDVLTFIGRMVQHIFPKGFKRIRYYGVQATKTFEKVKEAIQVALCKVKGVVKGAIKIIAPKSYRERYYESTGKDPLKCRMCGAEMDVYKIWHPKYGVIYDELKEILGGKYETGQEVFV